MGWFPDISEFNGTVDFDQLKASGADGVAIRSTIGTVRVDRQFTRNWSEAKRVGLPRIAYHFAYPAYNSAAAEASFFNAVVMNDFHEGDGIMLDCENDVNALPWPTGSAAYNWAKTWLLGAGPASYAPIWYCSPSFVVPHNLSSLNSTWPWWVAEYGVNSPSTLGLNPVFWQFTDAAPTPGVALPCDRNTVLRGQITDWLYGKVPASNQQEVKMFRFFDTAGHGMIFLESGMIIGIADPASNNAFAAAGIPEAGMLEDIQVAQLLAVDSLVRNAYSRVNTATVSVDTSALAQALIGALPTASANALLAALKAQLDK